jgi:putative Mg2+ transporter-C (MgtC) family protein
MPLDLDLQIAGRLLLAALLGGVVGLERELRRKAAGLRTNMLICLGSALFTLLSEEIAKRFGGDGARVASQLIPGIGFIGAGAILRERGSVVGLTTAATIFVVASVGMATGAGLYVTAVFATLLILGANSVLGWAEGYFGLKTRLVTFRLTTAEFEPVMHRAHELLNQMKIGMQHFQVQHVGKEFVMEFDADVSRLQEQQLLEKLSTPDVRCETVPLGTARE